MLQEQFDTIDAQQKTIDTFQDQLAEKKRAYNEINRQLTDEATKGKLIMDDL